MTTIHAIELEHVCGGAQRRASQDKDFQFGWSVSQVGGVVGASGKTVGGKSQIELGGSSMSSQQHWNLNLNGISR